MSVTLNTKHKYKYSNDVDIDHIHYLSNFDISFESKYKLFKDKGDLAWEYNPFKNFRVDYDIFDENRTLKYKKGQLLDLDTEKLQFDIHHPVDILCQQSYDGSVNLILNDDLNPPKLINSRFSPLENSTYEIVDRNGNNDTNIYDDNQFDIDSSLYKRITTVVNLQFRGLTDGGNLKVGNYVFYFKYADADGNETDFIEESGIVTCHIGNINEPKSIRGGIVDENSYKCVNFEISNADSNYEYLNIYYSRSTSNEEGVEQISVFKIIRNYNLKKNNTFITINGFETVEQLTVDDLNISYEIADAVKAQAQCQNILFFGNIVKPGIDYNNFKDLSLRFYPSVSISNDIGELKDYKPITLNPKQDSDYMYYNTYNIYNKLGYWNEEIYRLGVVYILADGSLSPVFNIRGRDNLDVWSELDISNEYNDVELYDNNLERNYITFNEETYIMENSKSPLENVKGVIRINANSVNSNSIYGINIIAHKNVVEELKNKHGIKGFFFVRQKRIPTILTQVITIGGASLLNEVSEASTNYYVPTLPLINNKFLLEPVHLTISGSSKPISLNFTDRIRKVSGDNTIITNSALCPDFELNNPYFNSIFTGSEFVLKLSKDQPSNNYFEQNTNESRLYQINSYKVENSSSFIKSKIITVPDSYPLVGLDKTVFQARLVYPERAGGISLRSSAFTGIHLRGNYGPYLGLSSNGLNKGSIYNVYIPQYDTILMNSYFDIRMNDSSPYYTIGNRLDVNTFLTNGLNKTFYRGDCFICDYTHRMNRNFQDPNVGFTDIFINPSATGVTSTPSATNDIDVGDWNAVKLGHWATFRVRSSMNLAMRTTDGSNINEKALTGKNRTFYPLSNVYPDGNSKIADSFVINKGVSSTTSDKTYIGLPDVPAIKNSFDSRIIYSDLHVTDAFKNGYRVFKELNLRDYTKVYGGIVKLIDINSNLLVIFEHGIALIAVNERVLAGSGNGGNVFVNTENVLPQTPSIISDIYGSQWSDSVIKTQKFIYGVDTIAKKIWRTNGQEFTIISDFKVQKFLNDNITLGEHDILPTLGLRNVKTHYNKSKYDVMFTFYDNLQNYEEKVWNVCFNEYTELWTTFYSWVPSFSSNIHNIFFSFDRNTSKWISKAWLTGEGNYIGLKNDDGSYPFIPVNNLGNVMCSIPIGTFFLNKDVKGTITYEIERDRFRNDLLFTIESGQLFASSVTDVTKIYQLNIVAKVDGIPYYQNSIAIATKKVLFEDNEYSNNWFYKHGQSGLFDKAEEIKPCYWYGKQHPFEFEFVVADKPAYHKVFENLQIISNKEAPESFHFEIVGEVYNFAEDKNNMYFRQEATKNIYQFNGSDITFNDDYLKIKPKQNVISNMMSLYQSRVDTLDEIEDSYQSMTTLNKNYQNMSGGEIVHDKNLNEFRIDVHIPGSDIAKVDRFRGNMNYQEDQWLVQIPNINYKINNESVWQVNSHSTTYPPLNLANNPLPQDLPQGLSLQNVSDIPQGLLDLNYRINTDSFDLSKWSEVRQAKLKDKYIKIKIRYTGNNLAVITAIKTLYNISYA